MISVRQAGVTANRTAAQISAEELFLGYVGGSYRLASLTGGLDRSGRHTPGRQDA